METLNQFATSFDNELTSLAAKSLGHHVRVGLGGSGVVFIYDPQFPHLTPWRPLLDYGAALRIVERLGLSVSAPQGHRHSWLVTNDKVRGVDEDLRRAIVLCAASTKSLL